ncbi:MAG TPA: hypothetical protein VNV17_15280 [Solirubrobacteraceae bacterium]|jgi:hypothetical protein|nr:hypothetical protein [Solirubrobacteraceae bacterium]
MLARRTRPRILSPAVLIMMVAALAATTASPSSAQPTPNPAPSSPASATHPAKPTPPAIVPSHGRPFVPVQGDWEGTANGFTASFNLVLDAVRQQRAGVPQYGIQDLVMLRPLACPPDPVHYGESIIGGRLPAVLGGHGALGLSRFGLGGGFTGRRAATLEGRYSLPSCRGTLTWHMHPAVRRTVANGSWMLRYSNGEHSTFHVQAGGRLATAIRLPAAIAACNGLEGTLDVFIGNRGGSSITQSGVSLRLRFANGKATGTLSASGCKGGPLRVTASHSAG